MFGKADRQPTADTASTPSPETYRALIEPIKVKNHSKRRSLDQILEDPPEFPALRDPEKEEVEKEETEQAGKAMSVGNSQ